MSSSVLYCLAYTADDGTFVVVEIFVIETSSFENYYGLIFPP